MKDKVKKWRTKDKWWLDVDRIDGQGDEWIKELLWCLKTRNRGGGGRV